MLTIAGVGPGNIKYMTMDVIEKIKNSNNILAFGRVGESVKPLEKDYTQVNRVDQIIDYLNINEEALLLASGDPNFFGIVEYLKKNNVKIKEVLPGLSSFQYMMAKLEKPWQGAKFISLHGRDFNLSEIVKDRQIIALIDKDNNPSFISNELKKLGLKGTMHIGFNLSYEDEKIIKINIGEEVEEYSSLGVVVIENEVD